MSGGEQQRVALARALVLRPALLLADEPTGNLDRTNSEQVHRLLLELNAEFGMTLVVVTHNLELAARMSRRVTLRGGSAGAHALMAGPRGGPFVNAYTSLDNGTDMATRSRPRRLRPAVLSLVSVLGLALLSVPNAPAQPAVGVVVVPFAVHAQADLAYLKAEIPEAMRQQFAEDGANARVLDAETAAAWRQTGQSDVDVARSALQTGADYVVEGSLTFIGQNFSLDARLLSATGDRPPRVFTAVGQGVENLPGAVKKLARDIGLTLFRRDRVAEVQVQGNQRIETDAIRRVIKTKPGDVFGARNAADDLKAVFGMGYFDDVKIQSERGTEGIQLVFNVTEKPTVRAIQISGNVGLRRRRSSARASP